MYTFDGLTDRQTDVLQIKLGCFPIRCMRKVLISTENKGRHNSFRERVWRCVHDEALYKSTFTLPYLTLPYLINSQ